MFENILRIQSEVNMNGKEISRSWKTQFWLNIKSYSFKAQLGLYKKVKTDVGPQGLFEKMWKMLKNI